VNVPLASRSLDVRLLRPEEIGPRERAQWRSLAGRAAEPNPFFELELLEPAFGPVAGRPRILVVEQRGDWRACLPVERRRFGRLPLPCLVGARHVYAFLGTPLVAIEEIDATAAALLRAALSARCAVLVLPWIEVAGPVHAAFSRVLSRAGTGVLRARGFQRAALERAVDDDYIERTKSHKHVRELARLRRTLERDAGGPAACVDRSDDPGAPREFLALEVAGWKGRNGTAMACDPAHAEWFERACASMHATGRLQILALECNGSTIAMNCNFLAGDGAFCFKIAHDERYARHSPGVLLVVDTVHHFHDRERLAWMDSCADPANAMINGLWPDRRRLATVALPTHRWIGRAMAPVVRRRSHEPGSARR
jgi:CelD/BcsL family acetyltransferase involved in cellulose biosynthesis